MSFHSHHNPGGTSASVYASQLPPSLTPLSSLSHDQGSVTPVSTSSLSSSSSIVSRQSSIRSTSSVVAAPMRKPVRGPASANAVDMTRASSNSSGLGHEFDSSSVTETVPSAPHQPQSYFNQRTYRSAGDSATASTPMTLSRSTGGSSSGGSDAITPGLARLSISDRGPHGTVTSNQARSFEPGSVKSSMSDWSEVGVAAVTSPRAQGLEAGPVSATAAMLANNGVMGLQRPDMGRAPSSNLSDKPAIRPATSRDPSAGNVVLVRKTPSDFTLGNVLGEGSYSTVTLVTDKLPPHHQYALKVLDKEHIKREKKTKYVLIERDTLKALDGHPGIVRLYWTFQDQHSLYYVLELAKNGELLKWIKKVGSFSLPSARFYAAQILSAIEHMHSRGVIHRDLKPENILLDDHMRIKLTDFGTAKLLVTLPEPEPDPAGGPPPKRARSFVGTPEYVSPEILSEGKESSRSSDYWGFGCILYQIIAGRPPFQAKTDYLMFQKIINLEYEFPLGFPPDARDLVVKLLVSVAKAWVKAVYLVLKCPGLISQVVDPSLRLGGGAEGIEAIKSHPFFTSEPAIDFATIWSCEPPPIKTGLVEPKAQPRGQFVLLDDFGPSVATSAHEMDDDDEAEHEVSTADNSSAGAPVGARSSEAIDSTYPEPPRTKWTGILSPSETITLASPVLVKRGLIKKKRILILTDASRLICIKESADKVTLKHEIWLGSALKGGVTKIGAVGFVQADSEGEKGIILRTSQQTLKFEDPSGGAPRWVAELNIVHNRGLQGIP